MKVTDYREPGDGSRAYAIDGGHIEVVIENDTGEWTVYRRGELTDTVIEDDVENLGEQPDPESAYGVALDATGDEEIARALVLVLGQEGR